MILSIGQYNNNEIHSAYEVADKHLLNKNYTTKR